MTNRELFVTFHLSKGEEMELFSTPTPTPAPVKKGRPVGSTKPKAAVKPKFNVPRYAKEGLVEALMAVADELTPGTATHAEKLRVAADLLELIEKAKA